LYGDAGGAPGALLAGPVTVKNIPSIFDCCTGTYGRRFPAAAVASGTQYWIVASTPTTGTGAGFEEGWEYVVPPKISISYSQSGNAWTSYPAGTIKLAGAV
jgi:hypothetical protein